MKLRRDRGGAVRGSRTVLLASYKRIRSIYFIKIAHGGDGKGEGSIKECQLTRGFDRVRGERMCLDTGIEVTLLKDLRKGEKKDKKRRADEGHYS